MTKPNEFDALQAQIDRTARSARECGFDPIFDFDDLAPARPIVWLVLAWVCLVAVFVLLLLAPMAVGASDRSAPQVWGVATTVSWHADRSCPICPDGQLNQANWGFGLEARFAHGLGAGVGLLRNSYSETSVYLIGLWQPLATRLHGIDLAAGAFAGAVTGYRMDPTCDRSICPAAGLLFTAAVEQFGINVTVLPALTPKDTTTVGLQLKVRFV